MQTVKLQTHCESCGGDAYRTVLTNDTVIIEFLEEVEFHCESCSAITYFEIEKRVGDVM